LSLNAATVRLAQKVGFSGVRERAEKCGISTGLDGHPSMALGSFEVTLIDLTAAYSVFATGRKVTPIAYTVKMGEKLNGLWLPPNKWRCHIQSTERQVRPTIIEIRGL
jgi:penicillin-binding protein 1A